MMIRAILCHHCAVELSEDDSLHYVFECHACVMAEHELHLAVRRDPAHPDGHRLANSPVETRWAPSFTPSRRQRSPAKARAA